jgi:membrane peptidoglycan carboxypeptidase
VLNSGRRAGARWSSGGKLAGVSVAAGLLAGAIALPAAGVVGVVARDAAKTFNNLPVPALGQLPLRSEILDSKGNVIATYYPGGTARNPGGTDRVPVTFNQISPIMRKAIVAQEDSRFWQHGAFDPKGALRAMLNDLHGNATQGGSDLAQQYVKNALVLTARTRAEQLAAESRQRRA